MPTIMEYYEFAKLTTASYIKLEDEPVIDGAAIARQSNIQERLPTSVANQMFVLDPINNPGGSVWSTPENEFGDNGYYGNNVRGQFSHLTFRCAM